MTAWRIYLAHLRWRFCYWLVCWVFLADVLVEIVTFTVFDLKRLTNRAQAWLAKEEE